jgi:3-oxoacyl-[acyl-carrier-protein] synthase III
MLQTIVFSAWSSATQPVNQLNNRGIPKMMHIDFEDVHDVTGWSTEDVDHLVLHKKLPGKK